MELESLSESSSLHVRSEARILLEMAFKSLKQYCLVDSKRKRENAFKVFFFRERQLMERAMRVLAANVDLAVQMRMQSLLYRERKLLARGLAGCKRGMMVAKQERFAATLICTLLEKAVMQSFVERLRKLSEEMASG